mmetsp:Transcript_35724/g.106613  ORF Transcript_35724/g.106613 Transcript_35724/m.106613 type:complete len:91 (+) Transcript_35724:639-911(+)
MSDDVHNYPIVGCPPPPPNKNHLKKINPEPPKREKHQTNMLSVAHWKPSRCLGKTSNLQSIAFRFLSRDTYLRNVSQLRISASDVVMCRL